MKNIFYAFLIISALIINVLDAASIKSVSFNILAPPWAKLSSYPESSAPYLPREIRRAKIIHFLNNIKGSADIIALQEVTPIEYGYISNALKEFVGIQANHDPDYWSQYITEIPPWEPNGNAIFLKKTKFKNINLSDAPLSSSGNHGALANAVHKETNKPIRALSVHFDSDTGGNRNREMEAALALLPPASNTIDLIIGDFNSSPQQGNYAINFELANFVDVLNAIGNTEITAPYTYQYVSSVNFGTIDHITVRNAIPADGDVVDNDLFILFPDGPAHANEGPRITENMILIGSDHFPIWGTIEF